MQTGVEVKTYTLEEQKDIYAEAFTAASEAITALGPEDARGLTCGFGWVIIRPARGPFVKFCKQHGIGDNGWDGGWQIENPGNFLGQQVDHKFAGAKAFARVLRRHGIVAEVGSRMD